MAITPAVIAAAFVDELPKIFNDAVQNERLGQPNYIRDGEPESIVGQVAQAVSRAACRNYGAAPDSVQAEAAGQYERACRPYLDTLEPGGGPGIALPFRGGQCDSQTYLGSYTTNVGNIDPGTPRTVFFKAIGPIAGVVTEGEPGNQTTGLRCRGALQREGTPFTCSGIGPTIGALRTVVFFSGGTQRAGSISGLTPCGLDNCGNPPAVVTPPSPVGDPMPPPFRFNPAPNIDIDVNVDVGPDGDINVDFGTGPITVDPFPDGGGDGGGGDGGGGNPPVAGEPGGSEDTGSGGGGGVGGETGGEAPDGKVLTGVRIDILSAPSSRSRFTETVDRGVAYVYMGTPTEGLGLEPTGALVRTGQFFFAQKEYLTSWAVRAKPGYNLRTTPYYKDVPE